MTQMNRPMCSVHGPLGTVYKVRCTFFCQFLPPSPPCTLNSVTTMAGPPLPPKMQRTLYTAPYTESTANALVIQFTAFAWYFEDKLTPKKDIDIDMIWYNILMVLWDRGYDIISQQLARYEIWYYILEFGIFPTTDCTPPLTAIPYYWHVHSQFFMILRTQSFM